MTGPQNKQLIVIAGPNAVGKTAFAIRAAKHFNTEIVSCDSRQIFKEMDIGVGRPSQSELAEVQHHFIASHSVTDEYNAGRYEVECNQKLSALFSSHDTVIMAGGTGLYIQSACFGLDPLPPKNDELRARLNEILSSQGIEALQKHVTDLGLDLDTIDHLNPQRLIRAIEIHSSPKPEASKVDRNYKVHLYYLNKPREEVYDRINKRVDKMMADGLEDEVRSLTQFKQLNALQTVGYKELFAYFDGDINLNEAVDKIKQNSRNYAKRQLTWFRNRGFTEIDETFPIRELITT